MARSGFSGFPCRAGSDRSKIVQPPAQRLAGEIKEIMSKILVALWSYDSHAHYGEAAADVLRKLKNNLTRCRIELASMSTSRRPTTVQAIFVAAEYLFTAPGVHTREPMSS